jgi:ketosteroid isomerase-like protein
MGIDFVGQGADGLVHLRTQLGLTVRENSIMSTAKNKARLQHVFEETAKGNGQPFVEALADDVQWTIIGTTAWSGIYEGKRAVVAELLAPLAEQFTGANIVGANRFEAEGDLIVVEGRNHSVTKTGPSYPNRYCWVFVMRDGEVAEITEYSDTQLIAEVLTHPSP